MSIQQVSVDGIEYPLAPMEPEKWDQPSPANLMAVTPEVARNWLRYNYRNRTQREQGKRDYSADMRERNFPINGSTITFSRPHLAGEDELVPEGSVAVMDGQHRLESCATGGVPFVTYVAFGLAPSVRHTIDTGIRRQLNDVLHMRGEHYSNDLASVSLRAYVWSRGSYHLPSTKGGKTHSRILEFIDENPEVRRSVEVAVRCHADFAGSTGHPLRKSVTGLAHWLLMKSDEIRTPEFFARMGDGAEMVKHDPIMFLRRRLVRDQTVKKQENGDSRRRIPYVEDWQYLCYIIRTWNARLEWDLLKMAEQEAYTYVLLGPNDGKKIPPIKTADQVQTMVERRRAKEQNAMLGEADEQD